MLTSDKTKRAALWTFPAAALLGLLHSAWRPAPLLVDIGPADIGLARGFRSDWERAGRDGRTTFRWCLDGSRLDLPVVVSSGDLRLRFRAARFIDTPAEVVVHGPRGQAASWTQGPQGFGAREEALGPWRGPLTLQFRTRDAEGDGASMAMDWVEVVGAGFLLPRRLLVPGLLAFFGGLPLLLARWGRLPLAVTLGAVMLVGVLVVHGDRLGGLVALSRSGLPSLCLTAALALLQRAVSGSWAESRPLVVASAAASLAVIGLVHPRYHYPDVDTHARLLAAIRAEPSLALDPTPYQLRTGAWTRGIAGARVGFPYSPGFHVTAWPLALLVGDEKAIKLLAALAVGATVVLVGALARRLGLAPPFALAAQVMFTLLPVVSSRLVLALFPTLLAQALELAVVAALACGGLGALGAALSAFALVQLTYTGSVLNLGLTVGLFAFAAAWRGERALALRLGLAILLATAAVIAIRYAAFLPVLVADVLPHAGGASDPAPNPLTRWLRFYGWGYGPLVLVGLTLTRRGPAAARDAVWAALSAGTVLLAARAVVPVLLRDAKEVELLAAPVAVLSASALAALWSHSRAGRMVAAAGTIGLLAWGIARGAEAYGARLALEGR